MGFQTLLWNSTFVRVLLVGWLVTMGLVGYLLFSIDRIVNVDLYNYGLRFDAGWAVSYWSTLRVLAVCLIVPSFLTGATLVMSFLNREDIVKREASQKAKPPAGKVQSVTSENMVISCPKCKRIFSKPLVMLDFTNGKTRFINVCPYCNRVLGNAPEGGQENNVHIVEPEKKVITEKGA